MIYALFKQVRSEGTSLAKDVDRLQQTCFARPIVTANQVEAGVEIESGTGEISKICQA